MTEPPRKCSGLSLSISKFIIETKNDSLRRDATHLNTRFIVSLEKATNISEKHPRRAFESRGA